jgi:asparagine N-glycosylation enzyme membrane subunit Stt3
MATDSHRSSAGPLSPILLGGLIAGTLDISYACIYSYVVRGTSPVRILQSVASGALGAKAFTGGAKTAALGLVFHFLIAIIAAAVFYLASRRLRFLVTQAVICGIFYGVCVYVFMNLVVLPLSAISFKMSYPWPSLIGGLLIHMFGIGLPISLVVRRYSK